MIATLLGLTVALSPNATVKIERVKAATTRFATGSTRVPPPRRRELESIAKSLLQNEARDLLVVGHSDRSGSQSANKDLSRARASAVAKILVTAGWPAERVERLGLGDAEPTVPGRDASANAANRRVEVWLVAPNQVGWVSWRRRRLEARHESSEWFEATIRLPLQAKDRVRTRGDSAGEITLRSGHILYLGPSGSLIVYPESTRARRQSRVPSQVRLELGTVLTRTPKTLRTPLALETGADASIRGRLRDVRIEALDNGKASAVSVFDGNVRVAARGQTVRVRQGFGTRVRRGRRPERPRRLPPPPRGLTGDAFVWDTLNLSWTPPGRGLTTMVEVSRMDANGRERLIRSWVATSSASSPGWAPGQYTVRLRARDRVGLTSRPSKPFSVEVVGPPPQASIQPEGPWLFDGPGWVETPTTATGLVFVNGTETSTRVFLSEAGPRPLRLARLRDGQLGPIIEHTVRVVVPQAEVGVEGVRVTYPDGRPGPAMDLRLEPEGDCPESSFGPCTGAAAGGARLPLLEPGRYGWPSGKAPPSGRITLVDPARGVGQSVAWRATPEPAPVPALAPPSPEARTMGAYLGARGGVAFREAGDNLGFGVAELGVELSLDPQSVLRIGGEVGYAQYRATDQGTTPFALREVPFSFEVDVAARGVWRPWVGVGVGARALSLPSSLQGLRPELVPMAGIEVGFARNLAAGLEGYLMVRAEMAPPLMGSLDTLVGRPSLAFGIRAVPN